jgi:3D (Asp-Asp-Asp) domain-containing protein
MRSRTEKLAHVHNVRYKVAAGMVLLWMIPCSLIHCAEFNPAAAGTSLREGPKGPRSLQTLDQPAAHKLLNDRAKQDSPWKTVLMRVTGYCPCRKCCGKSSDGITASGHRIRKGDEFVAADKAYLFGTKVIVPGYNSSKPVEVLDRGRAIHGNRLDVFFHSHRQALAWGVRYLLVKVRKHPK